MENEFLHKINVKALLDELGMTKEELAALAGYSRPSNLGKWSDDKDKGGARPSYNTFVKLIEAGASVETLFGVEYKHQIKNQKPREIDQEEFMAGVRKALADIAAQGLKDTRK